MDDWSVKNREFARQHTHNHSPEDIEGMRMRPGRKTVMVSTLRRLGCVQRAHTVANTLGLTLLSESRRLIEAEEFLASRWYKMTPAEREIIYPWSVCMAYRTDPHRERKPIGQRYPYLLRAMSFMACLSPLEAISCIREFKAGSMFAGEAVNHYGGPLEVIRQAIARRHAVASMFRQFGS